MIKILKANKIACLFLIIIAVLFIINPNLCASSSLNAVKVWSSSIFPIMFPFFVLSRCIVCVSSSNVNIIDKYFSKFYHCPSGSLKIFFLSLLAGYPMGAKLISIQYSEKNIDKIEAEKMLSFCSISGPMFIIGSVGLSFLLSYKAGLVILISNIIAALINGQIYKEKFVYKDIKINSSNFEIGEIVYDSLKSILMILGFLVISFVFIDALNNLKILDFLSMCLSKITCLDNDLIKGVFSGLLEMTRGILDISKLNFSLRLKTIISSGLIGFGGICVLLQSKSFLSEMNIKTSHILKQKITQGLFSSVISILICLIFKI